MLKLLVDIFLFVLFGIAPIAALIWIFVRGNKKAKAAEAQAISDESIAE